MRYILPLTDRRAEEKSLCGGKGAGLAKLVAAKLPAPDGFVVTTAAYRDFVGALDLAALAPDPAALRAALVAQPLPAALADEVAAALGESDAAYAVRSSSSLEDLTEAAFAGQHDTFLNRRGLARILDAVKACFISLWQERAVAYRRERGFADREVAMAVVVQRLVEASSAGVAFTVNPVSGKLDEIVISANFGLGESVVAGEVEADQHVLDKASLATRQTTIGAKSAQTIVAADGVATVATEAAAAAASVLSPAQVAAVARLARTVEQLAAFPQDIEWAFAGDTLWLLQARPVTTLPPLWTRDESAERFPNIVTPLSWDFVEDGFHAALAHSFALMGLPPFRGKWFALFDGYVYGNETAVELYMGRSPPALRSLDELRALLPQWRARLAWAEDLPRRWSRDLDRYLLSIGALSTEPLAEKTLPELWNYVQRVNGLGREYFKCNIAISIAQNLLYRALLGALAAVLGNEAARQMLDDLLGSAETKTGLVNDELHALAAELRAEPRLLDLLRRLPSEQILAEDRLAEFPAFAARFRAFLGDHGHREVDFDPYHPTWLEAPSLVLDTLKLMAEGAPGAAPAAQRRERRERAQKAEFALLSMLPEDLRPVAREFIDLVRTYTALDDIEHYETSRLTLPLRRGLRALGERLKARGIVEDGMDAFFARAASLGDAIATDDPAAWRALAAEIATAKRAYRARRGETPAWELRAGSEAPVAEDALAGIAGSAGSAEGEVFMVHSTADFPRFPRGAILVARTTNPAWTALFPLAKAVITESGGPLSHGPVTAREMGIPAVMAVRGVMARLRTGDRVRVDGAAGRVTLM